MALGANLGDPAATLAAALGALACLGSVDGVSRLWATDPVGGPPDQPMYLNAVVGWRPAPAWGCPERALAALLAIEAGLGRVRREPWGPRHLDLDLLDWRDGCSGGRRPRLRRPVLPHPRAHERAFVLVPWAEVAPAWRYLPGRSGPDLTPPAAAPSIAALARVCDRTGVRPAGAAASATWVAAAGRVPRAASFA